MWTATEEKLFSLPAYKHTITKEMVAASKLGEIYAYSSSVIGIVVYCVKTSHKLKEELQMASYNPISEGEEDLIFTSVNKVKKVAKILNIKNNGKRVLKKLNT